MKYTGPSCRLCRKEGEKLFLKGDKCLSQKCPILKKNYIPGQHGEKKSFKKLSEYGRQMRAKQKAKRVYQIAETQFKNYYKKAVSKKGVTGTIMQQMIERRIDNTIYRCGFAVSRKQARQMVAHGLIRLNGKKCTAPSRQVKIGDKITIKDSKKGSKLFERLAKEKDVSPKWLKVDLKKGEAEVTALPEKDDMERSLETQLIVESYSK
jgi:small subunit ribosomal protein S4